MMAQNDTYDNSTGGGGKTLKYRMERDISIIGRCLFGKVYGGHS